MSGARHCACTICSVEKSLEEHPSNRSPQEAYTTLLTVFPALRRFPTAPTLLADLRNMRHVNGSGEASDNIFRTLREGLSKDGGISEVLLLLGLVPMLHAPVTSFARACPALDRDDLAQQAIAIFIELAHSEDWRRHETHLAFSLARELRRAVPSGCKTKRACFPNRRTAPLPSVPSRRPISLNGRSNSSTFSPDPFAPVLSTRMTSIS